MNISFAVVSNVLPTRCRMTNDYKQHTQTTNVDVGTKLFLDCSNLKEDDEHNLWLYSPVTKMYYELYRYKLDKVLMDVFPSMYANITSDCKAGLALYTEPDTNSDVIVRKNVNELYEITPVFKIDKNKNIWIYSINIDPDLSIKDVHDINDHVVTGWLIYKNVRNNFANLYIHGRYKSLLTRGSLDPDKVAEFTDYVWEVKFKNWLKVLNPLQMFANGAKTGSNSISTAPNGPSKSVTFTQPENRTNTSSRFQKFHGGYARNTSVYPDPSSVYTDNFLDSSKYGKEEHDFTGMSTSKVASAVNIKTGEINGGKKWDSASIVKNTRNFPKWLDNNERGMKRFDYYIYADDIVKEEIDKIRERMMFDNDDYNNTIKKLSHQYNRYKVATPGDVLSRGVPHVFFTRPDCHLYTDNTAKSLASKVKANANFNYAFYHKPYILQQLSQNTKLSDDWMWLLSNKVLSFQPSDENIDKDTYGTSFHKQAIAYGRSNNESKAAGEFSCTVQDTRDLDLLHLHKLWTDYIAYVYTGKWVPKRAYLWQKILDYACSAYYIVTSEDGESIIFWSKYYGVFPTNVPSSSYGWNEGSFIENQKLSITYQYSFKEDYNPQSLIELNLNSNVSDGITYQPIYDASLGMSSRTWVGSPYIETIQVEQGSDYQFKLRFKPV